MIDKAIVWDCPLCECRNIDYVPLPSLECLCEFCSATMPVEWVEEHGLRNYEVEP